MCHDVVEAGQAVDRLLGAIARPVNLRHELPCFSSLPTIERVGPVMMKAPRLSIWTACAMPT